MSVFSHPSFQSRCGFAPLREIHGGGLAAQVGRFGETTLPVFLTALS